MTITVLINGGSLPWNLMDKKLRSIGACGRLWFLLDNLDARGRCVSKKFASGTIYHDFVLSR